MGVYSRRGQSFAEYATLLALVASVFLAMQVYVRRGLQGRFKEATDYVPHCMREKLGVANANAAFPDQYEPEGRTAGKTTQEYVSTLNDRNPGGATVLDYSAGPRDAEKPTTVQTQRIREVQEGWDTYSSPPP